MQQPYPHIPRRPSPAVSFIGRQNSGKTTLLVKVIKRLSSEGLKVASIKHHGHPNFSIDVPGKDSYRHREAGTQATAILSESKFALTQDLTEPMSIKQVLGLLRGYDTVLVEGFRGVGIPAIELLRAENPKDQQAAPALIERLGFVSGSQNDLEPEAEPSADARPDGSTPQRPSLPAGIVTDMPEVEAAAHRAQVPVFAFGDIEGICTFVKERFVRAPLTITIQAGGESKRMGQSKARTPFLGHPLIEHMLDLVTGFADEVVVTSNELDKLEYLKTMYPGIVLVSDLMDTRGSLPGLLTALHYSSNELTGVIACDMIAFNPNLLTLEANMLQASGKDAVVPYNMGFWEPFAGVYRKSTCEAALRRAMAQGATRMQDLINVIDCQPFDSSPYQQPGSINPFANVNTPTELAQAEVLYRLYG